MPQKIRPRKWPWAILVTSGYVKARAADGNLPSHTLEGSTVGDRKSIEFLVVDDSPTMRQLVVHGLRRIFGAHIDEAGDGVEACKKLASKTYDLVMLDINMPLLDGLKVLSHIRSSKNNAQTCVIMLTTEGGEVEKARAQELGANAYLTKPVQASVIQKAVKALLGIG